MSANDEFSPLPFRRRSVPQKGTNVYRIVQPDGQSVLAEGRTAAEALQKSGVPRAMRIIRESYENKVILGKDDLPLEDAPPELKPTAAVEAAPMQDLRALDAPVQAQSAASAATPQAKPPLPEQPKELTEEEVKRLLEDGKN